MPLSFLLSSTRHLGALALGKERLRFYLLPPPLLLSLNLSKLVFKSSLAKNEANISSSGIIT